MRQDNYPNPLSDPEADGIPAYADDDSAADAPAASVDVRAADGPDPAPLPGDETLAVDRFGTTPEEAREGESVVYKLAREESETPAPDVTDEGDALTGDLDEIRGDAADEIDIAPIQANRDSVVSMYDVPDELGPGAPVGRLVDPEDSDLITTDAGDAGGGATAEEAALHEVREF